MRHLLPLIGFAALALLLVGCSQHHQAVEALPSGVADAAPGDGPLIVTPADGRTTHHPTYYHEVPLRSDRINPTLIHDPIARLTAALGDPEADNWSLRNLTDAVVAPLAWGAQSALIPVRQFTGDPLLKTVTTPPSE